MHKNSTFHHFYIYHLHRTMDHLLNAIAITEPPCTPPPVMDSDLDEVFADCADYDMMGIPDVEALQYQPQPDHAPPNYIQELAAKWTAAFQKTVYYDMIDPPLSSLYKLKNMVKAYKEDNAGTLHKSTGKCSSEVILMSLIFKGQFNVPNSEWLLDKLREYLEHEYKRWASKKESTARTTTLIKFKRYHDALFINTGLRIIEDN